MGARCPNRTDLPASQSHKATPQRPRTQRATSRRRRFLLSCANGSASWRGVRTSALKTKFSLSLA